MKKRILKSAILFAMGLAAGLGLWVKLAPTSAFAPTTEAYIWRNVVIKGGGFVTGIVFHPTERDLMYARTDVGGAYRWDETDSRWVPITDWVGRDISHVMGVDSLAVDPSDPDAVYVVGGQYTQSWAANAAVLRSTDRGATWQITHLPFKMGGNEDGRSNGERLAVDPNKNNILFLGTRNAGLWKSTDYGATWSRVTSFPVMNTANGAGLVFVQFMPSSGAPGTPTPALYVGVSETTTHLYQSTDAGASWQAVPGQPSGIVPHHAALDANGVLYLAYGDRPGPNGLTRGAVWKYDTISGGWTNITPPTGQGGFAGVSVDAQHPGTLVVSTLDRWWPRDELYRSTTGGASWTPVFNTAAWDHSSAPWSVARTPHWLGDVEIDPLNSDRVLFVTGYGIWGCDNLTNADRGGMTNWTFRNDGLEETVPLALISPPRGAPLLSALGDIGGFRHEEMDTSPIMPNYFSSNRTTNTSLDFAEQNPDLIVRAHWGTARGSYSLDGGLTWTDFRSRPPAATQIGPNAMAVSADGATLVWMPKGAIPYYSTDYGASWLPSVGGPTDPNSWQVMWPVADRVNPSKFYIYHVTEGRFYVSADGGRTYRVTTTLPNSGGILRAVPGFEGHLWLPAQGNGLYRSTDSGASFTKVTSVQEAYQVGFGQPAPAQAHPAIYMWGKVNTVSGIFRSNDAGVTWARINDDQHQFGWINIIIGDPNSYGRVYLGTGGRGIIYGDPQ